MVDLSDSVEFGMVLLDEQGRITLFNRWMREHARLVDAPKGERLESVFGEALNRRLLQSIDQALHRGHSSRLSSALHPSPLPLFSRDTGDRMRHAVDIVALLDANGQRNGLLQVRDMTESYRREEVLRRQALAVLESERRLTATLAHAPIGMAVCGLDDVCSYANRALAHILGAPAQTLVGSPAFGWVYPDDQPRHREFLAAIVALPGVPSQIEERWRHATGSPVSVRVTATRVDGAAGEAPYVIKQIESIDDRKQKEQQIVAALEEKETLLREVYHRVKNNLQVIQSLLNLKRRSVTDQVARDALAETAERVRSMALVHEKLYQSNQLSEIDLAEYLADLLEQVKDALGARSRGITVTLEAGPVKADLNTAVPFGLIVTELLSNAVKHAFVGRSSGHIQVRLKRAGAGAVLEVMDDGVGFAPGIDPLQTDSLGLKLVTSLATQIDGRFSASVQGGTRFELAFSRLVPEGEGPPA